MDYSDRAGRRPPRQLIVDWGVDLSNDHLRWALTGKSLCPEGVRARLMRRVSGGVRHAWIQAVCAGCHEALMTSSFANKDHPRATSYPLYDERRAPLFAEEVHEFARARGVMLSLDADGQFRVQGDPPQKLFDAINKTKDLMFVEASIDDIVEALATHCPPYLRFAHRTARAGELLVCDGVSPSFLTASAETFTAHAEILSQLRDGGMAFVVKVRGRKATLIDMVAVQGRVITSMHVPFKIGSALHWPSPDSCPPRMAQGLFGVATAHPDQLKLDRRGPVTVKRIPPEATDNYYPPAMAVLNRGAELRVRKPPVGMHRSPEPHDRNAHMRRKFRDGVVIDHIPVSATTVRGGRVAASRIMTGIEIETP